MKIVDTRGTTRSAVDVGGTFTDVVLIDDEGRLTFGKVPTTPENPAKGVFAALERVDAPLGRVSAFTHGSTLGLNALLTRTGARTAVIATRGFRDVYLLGRTSRKTNYDIKYRKPRGLLERVDTFEVEERMLFDGTVHTPLNHRDAYRIAEAVRDGAYEAVAVAFLHSYSNDTHERGMREIILQVAPGVEVTLSSSLSREYREYERTSTAVLDAYIKPLMRTYLQELEQDLSGAGFQGRFFVMGSAGGAVTARSAREQPVKLILSGPAGGVIGAAGFASIVGEPNLVTIDMGGTSLDASLIIGGEPVSYQGAEFEDLPMNISSLYIHTIGAGGGSIAWIDQAGGIQVGPRSAGARPGPASYAAGGTEPTVTDAALLVGYLGTETPLAGMLTLDPSLARMALKPLVEATGMSVERLARGILQISATKIVGAVRAITVELGRDPKDFALLAFGGGGGLLATDVARQLGMRRVIIPLGQGAFSAMGMLMADVRHDLAQTMVADLESVDADSLDAIFARMELQAAEILSSEGFPASRQVVARAIDLRYAGQEHSVTLSVPRSLDGDPKEYLESRFHETHEQQYGHVMTDPIQATTFRVKAVGAVDRPRLPLVSRRRVGALEPIGKRPLVQDDGRATTVASLFQRDSLLADDEILGPAVIVEHTATTVLGDGDRMLVGSHGEMVVTLGGGE